MTTHPWIQTAQGRAFPLLGATAADVDWLDVAESLSKICRFNGHTTHFYSVAQHCVLVADMLEPDLRLHGLLHDAHEAYIGDHTTPMKTALKTLGAGDAMDALEMAVDTAIHAAAGLEYPLPTYIRAQVKLADLTALSTERRDLLRAGPEWGGQLPAPLATPIKPWPWTKAMEAWLDRLGRWCPTANRRAL